MIPPLPVPEELSGVTLDEFLALKWPRVAKGALRRLIQEGSITVGGMATKPSLKLRSSDVILFDVDPGGLKQVPGATFKPTILYQDEHVVAVNKPAGFPVEPGRWGEHPVTLTGALLDWAALDSGPGDMPRRRPRAVHRLDLGTSGVILYALDLDSERHFRTCFEKGELDKRYHALALGEVTAESTIDRPLAPDPNRGGLMRINEHGGKASITEIKKLKSYRGYTLLECRPRTGRTHQIRAHLASIGHPLAVDPRYGGRGSLLLSEWKPGYRLAKGRTERPIIERLTLHAASLEVPNMDGKLLKIQAPWPKDFRILMSKLDRWRRADSPYSS